MQGLPALRDELALYLARTRGLDVSGDHIVIAPGCKIALFFALMALVEPGDEVLFPEPGFPGYPSIARGLGGVPVAFELSERHGLQPDPDEVAARITPRTKVLITNSPGNPTGTVYTDAVQRRLAELAVAPRSLRPVRRDLRADRLRRRLPLDVVVPRHGGAHADHRRVLQELRDDRLAARLHRGAAAAGRRARPARGQQLHVRRRVHPARRDRGAARPRAGHAAHGGGVPSPPRSSSSTTSNRIPGFRCAPPEGAFYAWVNVAGTGAAAEEVCRILLEHAGVAAIPGAAFGPSGKDFVRFSFASSTDTLREAIERIRAVSAAWQRTAAR